MTLRKPIIAALLAALLLAAYLVDRRQVRDINLRHAQSLRIMEFDFMDAVSVSLENESGTYRLEKRDGDQWWLTQPVELRAEASQVRALVDNIRGAKKSLPFTPGDLAQYGLDHPMPIVTVHARVAGKPERMTLHFGNEASQLGRVYAMIEGTDEVFTVGDWVRNHARKDLHLLRNKSLLEFDPLDIRAVSVGGARTPFALERNPQGDFPWLLAGTQTPANGEMVERALAAVSSARAVAILDSPTSPGMELGFTSPTLTLELATPTTGPLRLEIGNKLAGEDEFFARSNTGESVGVLRVGAFADFLRPSLEWSTRRFIWENPADIRRIETRSGQAEMALVRGDDGQWSLDEFPDIALHPGKLEALLHSATSFVADKPIAGEVQARHGMQSPSLEFIIWNKEGQSQGLRVGTVDTAEGIAYAERLQDGTIWGIDFQRVNILYKFRRDIEERRIRSGFAAHTRRVELVAGQSTVTVEREGGIWRLRFPGESVRVVRDDVVETFLERAESMEWNSELVSGEVTSADLEVRFLDGDGAPLYRFEVLVDADGDRLLRTDGRTYFVDARQFAQLDRAMVALLQRESE